MKNIIYKLKENLRLLQDIKGVFRPMQYKAYIGRIQHGCPYYYPRWFNTSIIKISKTIRKYERCDYFKLFGYYIYYGCPIRFHINTLGWKDKYGTPRFEWSPGYYLYFFLWQICIWHTAPDEKRVKDYIYFEMVLWYLHYSDKDVNKAEQTWGWSDMKTKKSTWDNSYVLNK